MSPFLVLYFQDLGFTGSLIGILVGVPRLVTLVGGPAWSGIADVTSQHRRILILALVGTALSAGAMLITENFWAMMVLVCLFALFMAPVMPLVDNAVLDLLGAQRNAYGQQRLWGTIGWGASTAALGIVTQHWGLRWMFYAYLLLIGIALVFVLRLKIPSVSLSTPFRKGLAVMMANRLMVVLMVTVFLLGLFGAMVRSYIVLHLGALGASRTVIGWAMTLGVVGELPIFFLGDRLLRQWGARGLMGFSALIFAAQAFLFALIEAPYLMLPAQMLHGPSFSAMLMARVSYAKTLAPKGMGATAQAVLGALGGGFSGALGAALGGVLYDAVGGAALFALSGLGGLVALGVFWVGSRQGAGVKGEVQRQTGLQD